MRPEAYGERFADIYDEWYESGIEAHLAAEFLSDRVSGGEVLELGVGTGRIALLLADRGHAVTGIDVSEPMLDRLRKKPGGENVRTVLRSMVDLDQLGPFSLIYAAFNGLFGLQSAEEQARLFVASAEALAPDGLLVLEASAPRAQGLSASGRPRVISITETSVLLEAAHLDEPAQRLDLQVIELSETGTKLYPASLRYAYQNEMELMASAAGLDVRERLSSWAGEPVLPGAQPSITIYGKLSSQAGKGGRAAR